MTSVLDLIKQQKAKIEREKASTTPVIRPAPGKHKYRILPGWRGGDDPTFFHEFGMHYIKGLNNSGQQELKKVYICVDKTFDRSCPICAAISKGIRAADTDGIVSVLKEGTSKKKYLINVLHLTDASKASTPQVMEIGVQLFNQLLELIEEYPDMIDPKTGRDIIINRSGSGLDTSYTMMVAASSQPVPADALNKIPNLDAVVSQESASGEEAALLAVGEAAGLPMPSARTAIAHQGSVAKQLANEVLEGDVEFEDADISAGLENDVDDLDDVLGDLEDVA